MSKAAVVRFADKILQHFPPWQWDEGKEAAWAATMVQELAGFSDEVIERAAREMVRTRRKEKTPMVSECIDACVEARRWIDADKTKSALQLDVPAASHLDHTAERLRLADSIVCNPSDPVCVDATKNAWIGLLHSFARKNGRMPDKTKRIEYRKDSRPHKNAAGVMVDEVEWCRREAKDFDEAYAACVRGFDKPPEAPKGWMSIGDGADKALAKLGESMLARRNRLSDRVLRGRR